MKRINLCLQISVLLSCLPFSMQTQYTSVFSFGDSYTDTGNKAIISGGPATPNLWITKPPYGMTFFGHPTGRLSDGRLVIDFIGRFTFICCSHWIQLDLNFACILCVCCILHFFSDTKSSIYTNECAMYVRS